MSPAPRLLGDPEFIDNPAWRLQWLTPLRCRIILINLLLLGGLFHLRYLHNDCPVDLVGDEAQYWDWSRQIDLSYYSKGPLVAYIIRASCAIFGDNMPAVRYPAILLGVGTSILFYLTALRLFGSERLALGTVLLTHLVPMFIAGSVLMTIDPPFFFCWAAATYCAVRAYFDHQRWMWLIAGALIGIGFLAKYAAFLWWPGVILFLIIDNRIRRGKGYLSPWGFVSAGVVVSALFTTPVILWNMRNGWVSALHVAKQTGARDGGLSNGNLLEFIGGQIGVLGPPLAVLIVAAIAWTLNFRKHDRRALFLATIGLFFLSLTLLVSVVAKVQQNWAAPAYFTLLILAAYFIGHRLRRIERWKPWRPWVWATIVLGILTMPVLHDTSILYPLAAKYKVAPARFDPLLRARGWEELGAFVSEKLRESRPDTFILCDDYLQTAEMAFYVDGQPKTYCAGSYFHDAKRLTQYDMWKDRALDQPQLLGRDAVYIGKGPSKDGKSDGMPSEVKAAFEHVSQRIDLPLMVRGVEARTFRIWLCRGFKGMKRREGESDF